MTGQWGEGRPASRRGALVIDGGHFTLRRMPMGDCAPYPVGLYYSEISTDAAALPFETARVPRENADGRCWAVFRAVDLDQAVRLRAAIPQEVMHLSGPSKTETGTLRKAIAVYRLARRAGRSAKLRIMIGDLGIPAELRALEQWAMPPIYRALLERNKVNAFSVLLESRCRNIGNRRARDRFKKLVDRNGRWGSDYRKDGYGVVRRDDGGAGAYYLVADALIMNRLVPAAILLTQDGTRPTCAVTLAASLLPHMKEGVTDYVAIHDEADDPRIRAKIIDGAAVAAYLGPRSAMTCHVVTLDHGRRRAFDRINYANLRSGGRPGGFRNLLEKVSQKMRRLDPRWMTEASPAEARQS